MLCTYFSPKSVKVTYGGDCCLQMWIFFCYLILETFCWVCCSCVCFHHMEDNQFIHNNTYNIWLFKAKSQTLSWINKAKQALMLEAIYAITLVLNPAISLHELIDSTTRCNFSSKLWSVKPYLFWLVILLISYICLSF